MITTPTKPTREDVIAAITEWGAAKFRADRTERQLSRVLRAAYGEDGITYGRRRLKPTADDKVATEWLETYPAKSPEPELSIEQD